MADKSSKLWAKAGASQTNPIASRYMIGDSLRADNRLLPYDAQASMAHAQMLATVGLLTTEEANNLTSKLEHLVDLHRQGKFVVTEESEDVHTAIENYLVAELGPVGKKIHVGRSRNDQVLVAMRLFTKANLKSIQATTVDTARAVLRFAKMHEFVPMPGFTHMQHAMPSSIGQWAGAFVESLCNDIAILKSVTEIIDQNPLGSAAGFGTAVPINREETTKRLGFAKTQINSIFCQNSRTKFDSLTLNALLQVMLTLGKIGNDLVVFTSQEFGFFKVDDSLTTGSSIMPQKRNLDVMEVLRANVSVVQSLMTRLQTVGLNLISGYNKDAQIANTTVMDAFDIVDDSLKVVQLTFEGLKPNKKNLDKAFDDVEIFAADYANELVAGGMPFREAYKQVGENLATLAKQDPEQNIRRKTHIGATGNLCLNHFEEILA